MQCFSANFYNCMEQKTFGHARGVTLKIGYIIIYGTYGHDEN